MSRVDWRVQARKDAYEYAKATGRLQWAQDNLKGDWKVQYRASGQTIIGRLDSKDTYDKALIALRFPEDIE